MENALAVNVIAIMDLVVNFATVLSVLSEWFVSSLFFQLLLMNFILVIKVNLVAAMRGHFAIAVSVNATMDGRENDVTVPYPRHLVRLRIVTKFVRDMESATVLNVNARRISMEHFAK